MSCDKKIVMVVVVGIEILETTLFFSDFESP